MSERVKCAQNKFLSNAITYLSMKFLNCCNTDIFYSDSNKCQVFFSIVIIISSVFNLICAPLVEHEIDDWSDAMSTSLTVFQSRVVAITASISRGIFIYSILLSKNQKYKTTLESFDIYSPMTAVSINQCKLFYLVVFSLSLALILPINSTKLYNLFNNHPDRFIITTYFFFFYLQNLSMCFIEIYFVGQCFMIYIKFREINVDLNNIKIEVTDYNKYPFLRQSTNSWSSIPSNVLYDKDFYSPKDREHPLANTIELLKIRHWLTREAAMDLNNLFKNHLGLSIVSLGVQFIFDIFTSVFHYLTTRYDKTIFRSKFLFFGWIIQYSFRFCVINLTSNITTKQVNL